MNRTWVEINIDNILLNISKLRTFMSKNTGILAAVKANAYGHDSIEISRAITEHVEIFGVASIDEALELRENNIDKPILILSPTIESDIKRLVDNNCMPNVNSIEYAEKLNSYCHKKNIQFPIHIEIDTGMNRTGIDFNDSVNAIEMISKMKSIRIEGIFSHFAEAEKNTPFTIEQKQRFDIIIHKLKSKGILCHYLHLANSAAIVNAENAQYNLVRPGIMMYGQYTSDNLKPKLELKPAMTMKSRICQIKNIDKGDTVSYTRSFTADKPMRIATVLIGYADGYSRLLSNKAYMYLKNKRCPVIGKVCMDLTMIDISAFKENDIHPGDEVEIFGEHIQIDELANMSNMINYEIMTGVGPRVPRVFLKNNKIYKTKNIMANANRGNNDE